MCSSFTTLSSLALGSFLLYLQSVLWEIELYNTAFFLLVYGLVTITIADLYAQKKYRKRDCDKDMEYKYISIRFCGVLLFVYMLSTLFYSVENYRLGKMIGYDDLSAIGEVKANIEELSTQMNPIVRQMYKVVTSASYIHSFIFASNVFLAKSKWMKEIKHLIPFLCTIIITLASGGRLNIYKVMIGLIFIVYMILRESSHWKKLYIGAMLKIGVPLLLGFVILFSSVSLIVKNNADIREKKEAIEYISYYAGSPIQVFNIKIEDGRKKWASDIWGYGTFSGIYKLLGVEADAKTKRNGSGMVDIGGVANYAGNAFTIFGRSYLDFGGVGMCIFMFISYFMFGRYYFKYLLNSYSSYKRNLRLMFYTYCYSSIIALAFYDNCYWILLSSTGLFTLLVLSTMYWIYFKKLLMLS